MKTKQNLIAVRLVLAALFSTCLLPTASAQTMFHGKFRLLRQVRWDKVALPPGEYSITIDSVQPMRAIVRAADGKKAAVVSASIKEDAAAGVGTLLITGHGNQRQVRSLNLPELGLCLFYEPLTEREREVLYHTEAQFVPVIGAKK